MEDIDAMFTDMLQEMDLLTQVRCFFLSFFYSWLHKDLKFAEHCCVFRIKQVVIPLSTESELIHTWNCAFHASLSSNYHLHVLLDEFPLPSASRLYHQNWKLLDGDVVSGGALTQKSLWLDGIQWSKRCRKQKHRRIWVKRSNDGKNDPREF